MPRTSLRLVALSLTIVVCAAFAATARAGLGLGTSSCGPTSAVFAPWGDQHQYFLTPNGGFEAGSSGWLLSGGARVVPGNEPFYVHSAQDSSSLLLPDGASADLPLVCFGSNTPGIRFFATSPSGSATVHVRIIAHGLLGVLSILDGGTYRVGSTWAPTAVFGTTFSQLNSALLGAKSIEIVLTASGPVQLDDVYVDPFTQY